MARASPGRPAPPKLPSHCLNQRKRILATRRPHRARPVTGDPASVGRPFTHSVDEHPPNSEPADWPPACRWAECHPQHAALGARLMRPRRAARPPAAAGGSARSTIGAVAHRGEDPPHDRGIAADSTQRGVIIWRPASRSRFGGLAFDDPDDVEGSHVRHDPPSPRPAQAVDRCHRPAPGPARCAPRGQLPAMAQGGPSPLLVQSRQCGSRYQTGALRSAVPRSPRTRRTADRGPTACCTGRWPARRGRCTTSR